MTLRQTEDLLKRCAELTEQREKELHSANCLDAALDQLHEEEGEQRERGGGSAKEWLKANRKQFVHGRERYSWTAGESYREELLEAAEMLEAYASSRLAAQGEQIEAHRQSIFVKASEWDAVQSRLAEVTAHRDALQQALDMLGGPRRCENCATLCAEGTELRAEVERVNDENRRLQSEVRRLHETVERLKGERDALREKTDNEFHEAAIAYASQSAALEQLKGERDRAWAALQEESENSAYHLKELRETEAALSQAQQALAHFSEEWEKDPSSLEAICALQILEGILERHAEASLPSDAPEATK